VIQNYSQNGIKNEAYKLFCSLFLLTFILGGCLKKPTKSIHQAAADGDIKEIKLYIENGADVYGRDKHGLIPLHYAVDKGQKNIAELLLSHGADINAKSDFYGATALHLATGGGSCDVVKLLLTKGADVNAKMKGGADTTTHRGWLRAQGYGRTLSC
jgi:ankyrin repeat protein